MDFSPHDENANIDFITIEGSVENITYRNESNGYTVLNFNDGGQLISAVGILPSVSQGDTLKLKGFFEYHKTYGEQFSIRSFEFLRPASSEAIYKYLCSGAIKGIGPSTAARIVEKFGADTLDVIESEPHRLAQIHGISLSKAKKIGDEYSKKSGEREVMLRFLQLNITPQESMSIYKALGSLCVEKINANPYLLCDSPVNFSFERVERLGILFEIPKNAPIRICAGILYVLRHNTSNGHTCIPRKKLIQAAVRLLETEEDETEASCDSLCEQQRIICENINGEEFVFLYELYNCEKYIAARIALMLNCPSSFSFSVDTEIDAIERINSITYEPLQKKAINEAFKKGLLILTGGPGTGKTTTLKAIITLIEQHKLKYCLAAPTGRAAKRMMELTGREAKTIHRLLEVEWGEYDTLEFSKNEKNPLDTNVIIIDELSMVDINLFEALLRAMRTDCRLIMVGDSNQLPAVGAGNVLCDLVESGIIPTICLNTIFRQAMQSLIITNAHRIISGERPKKGEQNDDFFLINEPAPKRTASLISELCGTRLPNAYGFDNKNSIQVLCPSRKGETGTVNLNRLLQEQINPPAPGKREVMINGFSLRTGDKVMQVRNNYDILWTGIDGAEGSGIFNGDIGIFQSLDRATGVISVRFEDKIALYSQDDSNDLEPAYAVTVHKSQGSEYDCVIIPLSGIPYQLCYRNLLYTAVTRAKRLLVLVGSEGQLCSFIDNNKKHLRYSGLKSLLIAADDELNHNK